MIFALLILLLGPAQTISGKYPHPDPATVGQSAEAPGLAASTAPPGADHAPVVDGGAVRGWCARIEAGDERPKAYAALGDALAAAGRPGLAYRAFHKAHGIAHAAGNHAFSREMQERKDALPRVPDRIIAAEEREARIWVDALVSYRRMRRARGEDPGDLEPFYRRFGRPEEDLNAIVRAHRIAFVGGLVGVLIGLFHAVAARRLRRRVALLPLAVAVACASGALFLERPGPIAWGAAAAAAGALAAALFGRRSR